MNTPKATTKAISSFLHRISQHTSFRFIVLLFLYFGTTITLQGQEYLANDMAFFQEKSGIFQRWLDAKGLGTYIKVDKLDLKKNGTELELFLVLRTSNPDTAEVMWNQLKRSFDRSQSGQTLHEALLWTYCRMMEIPPTQGNVQIYIPKKDGFGYDVCFKVWLWEENGRLAKEEEINKCRGPQPLDITIRSPQVQLINNQARVQVKGRDKAKAVFDYIIEYTDTRYGESNCERDEPEIDLERQTDYSLTFSVTNLCKEVLKDEKRSIWCRLMQRLGGNCNDMRRERLEFTFTYNSTEEGYQLTGFLTGKFGSGVYRPRISGYMDMEPDFEKDFLKPYVRKFQQNLKDYLEKR